MDRIEKLKTIHTRKLLQMLRETYNYSWGWEWEKEYTEEEIRAELSTREHIPNKTEGEHIRKERAKTRKEARNNRYVRRR